MAENAQPSPSRPGTGESPPTEEELGFIFSAFDRDNDGLISIDELVDVLRACGLNPTKTEAYKVMMEYDRNLSDGALNFSECVALFKQHWNDNAERDLIAAFRFLDKNKNGYIEKQELKKVLTSYGDDKMSAQEVDDMVSHMLTEADLDLNKKIDYYEFARVLTARPNWKSLNTRRVQVANRQDAAAAKK